jgi:hypothetical protein
MTARFAAAPNADLVWLHPELRLHQDKVLAAWSLTRADQGEIILEIPSQTGRAALAAEKFGLPGEVLLKGTGLNPETVEEVAKIRYYPSTKIPKAGDGLYGIREAFADFINSSMLESADIQVPKIRAIIQREDRHPLAGYRTAIMAREFINQTRISNLYALETSEARAELDRATEILHKKGITQTKLDTEELYFFLLERMARTTARLQDLGFEHSYLHSQQVTLAGELADNGTGTWLSDKGFQSYRGTDRPQYFKYDRQPTLALNMFIRAHGLTQERIVRLAEGSETLKEQTHSLLGVLMRIDPESAKRIAQRDPEKVFWAVYKEELSRLAKQPTAIVSTRAKFSETWDEFAAKNSIRLSSSLSDFEGRKRFDELKDDWKVEALPDAFVIDELIKLSARTCEALIRDLKRPLDDKSLSR